MQIEALDFIVLALATWRLAHMVTKDHIFARFREKYPLFGMSACVYCFSWWAGAIILLLWLIGLNGLVWIFALSGGALMMRAYTGAGVHDL